MRVITTSILAAMLLTFPRSAPAQPASLSLAQRAYVRIPFASDFTPQQFTLSLWLRPMGPGEDGGGTLVSKSGRPDEGNLLCSWWMGWQASSGRVLGMVVHEYATTGVVLTSQATVQLGQQAHAALTFDGTAMRLYINGVLDQERNVGFTGVYYSTEDIQIGAFNPEVGYTFNRFDGELDDVGIWNRALTDAEIGALARCEPAADSPGLLVHLPFTGDSLADASGHGHAAFPIGAIAFGPQATGLGTGSCCLTDFNRDGFVNPDDLSDFITCFFLDVQFPGTCPQSDFNADGFRDPDDLSDFITAFFTSAC